MYENHKVHKCIQSIMGISQMQANRYLIPDGHKTHTISTTDIHISNRKRTYKWTIPVGCKRTNMIKHFIHMWCMSMKGSMFLLRGTLQWRHKGCDGASNHQPHDCLLNRLFRRRSKKTSGHRWIPRTRGSNAENGSIWWCHHARKIN